MAYLLKQGGKTDYNYKEFMLDTADELKDIDVNLCSVGSVAYIISTGDVYMLDNKKEWRVQ